MATEPGGGQCTDNRPAYSCQAKDRSSRRSLGGGSGSRGGGGGGDQRLGIGPTTNRRPTASSLSPASGNSSKEALLLLYVLTKVVFLDKSKIALFALEITSRRLQHF